MSFEPINERLKLVTSSEQIIVDKNRFVCPHCNRGVDFMYSDDRTKIQCTLCMRVSEMKT